MKPFTDVSWSFGEHKGAVVLWPVSALLIGPLIPWLTHLGKYCCEHFDVF